MAPLAPGRHQAVHHGPISVLWLTSGIGCDGDSVALTAATAPSLEDLLRGCLPGMPPLILYNPMLAYETGDEFTRAFRDAAAGRLDPFVLVLEGSVPN
ncbi:MAG: hydrogenase expression protein HypE, partial [Trebonia sp.]